MEQHIYWKSHSQHGWYDLMQQRINFFSETLYNLGYRPIGLAFPLNGILQAHVYVCMNSSCWKADFWRGGCPRWGKSKYAKILSVTLTWPIKKVKVQRSRNFDWPYVRHFLPQNQSVWCSGNALPISLMYVNYKREFDVLTLRFEKNAEITQIGISRIVFEIGLFMGGLSGLK